MDNKKVKTYVVKRPEMNTAPVSEILENKIVPFAIVTPDGEWHERGNMGWWGRSLGY